MIATRLAPVPFLPELLLHQADEEAILFGGGYRSDRPAPFWAFAWPGGQALARYVLDHPAVVAGAQVLDVATGGGIVAIAAGKAGAARVRAVDVDPAAAEATRRNAEANGVRVEASATDVTGIEVLAPHGSGDGVVRDGVVRDGVVPAARTAAGVVAADVVLAGDVFYSRAMAGRMLAVLRRAGRGGARVLVGDPGRGFLPPAFFREVARYDVPVRPALEDTRVKRTAVWQLSPKDDGGPAGVRAPAGPRSVTSP